MQNVLYQEEIRSRLTSALFAGLALMFSVLFVWRYTAGGWNIWSGLCLALSLFFVFYLINYRMLQIQITSQYFLLMFGLFSWSIELENIQAVQTDESPWYIKYGGAGVHFALVRGKYRVFFNFLEYPRITVDLSLNQGPVSGVTFTTCCPDQIQELLTMELESHVR